MNDLFLGMMSLVFGLLCVVLGLTNVPGILQGNIFSWVALVGCWTIAGFHFAMLLWNIWDGISGRPIFGKRFLD